MDPARDVVIAEDAREAARAAAERLRETVVSAPPGRVSVALSGGVTPRAMHRLLAAEPLRSDVPWERVHLFFADERLVPAADPASNFGAARLDFLDALAPRLGGVHPIPAPGDPPLVARRYEEDLRRNFLRLGTPEPVFDLIFLGVGEDGHTASLFPGSPVLEETRRWTAAVKGGHPDVWRVTLTPPVLNRARRVVFLVTGAGKAEILRRLFCEPQANLPAQRVQPTTGSLTWLVDRAAAGRLLTAQGAARPRENDPCR